MSNNVIEMVLGNSSHNPALADANNRPFDGLLDNIRLYGSVSDNTGVLSLISLESIRSSDIAAIPEPSVAMLAGIGMVALVSLRGRRRTSERRAS